ncbi:MAG: histidine kinase [Flavobacteriales bacterium]|nr:MAG: histidine kinase [Flavobacteriales bacterium]
MFSKTKLYWLSQIVGWLSYAIIVGVYNVLTGNLLSVELVFSLLSIFLIGISVAHAFRLIIVKLNWMRFNIPRLIPRILLGTLIAGVVVYFLKSIIIERLIVQNAYEFNLTEAFPSIISWTLLYLIWSLLYFLFHFVTNYKKEEIKNLRWQAAKNEIELNKMKSQLNPHFIFNSMNSIRALINENPTLAKEAITQLSNVLRNSLLMGKQKLIPFGDEMKLVNDYLGLEKTRFEERLTIERDIDKNTEVFLLPPLMIQTIVENGIKHGTSKLPEGGTLTIKAAIENEKLKIVIYNSGFYDLNKKSETGFGLLNTIQRLRLLYGRKASFEIINEDNRVKTTLLIPKETIL